MARLTSDTPKALLEIAGKSIIAHSLDILDSRGFRHVTFVVGYMHEQFMNSLGPRHRRLSLEYVVSEDYAITEHGWSLYVTRESWDRERAPVIFMDADNLYDPRMLDKLMACPDEDLVLVDDGFDSGEREEELVLGRHGLITALEGGLSRGNSDFVGGFVGINKFSSAFMGALYPFMERLFRERGRSFKYERVFDKLIHDTGIELRYLGCGGLAWINVNHEADYRVAQRLAEAVSALLEPAAP